ncbi:MAG: MOSC domain-containing protein [Bacteroidota bacterium]
MKEIVKIEGEIVIGIFIADKKEGDPVFITSAEAVAHQGLVGDRYYEGSGTFSGADPIGPGREITLIEEENVDFLAKQLRCEVDAAKLRRNVVTRGVRLNNLVGRQFTIGDVRLIGVRLCHPCSHLERLSGWNVMTHLKDRGGLRADILDGGWLHVGDRVSIDPDVPSAMAH